MAVSASCVSIAAFENALSARSSGSNTRLRAGDAPYGQALIELGVAFMAACLIVLLFIALLLFVFGNKAAKKRTVGRHRDD
jgi:hypothetical protein